MKNPILFLSMLFIYAGCNQTAKHHGASICDGFYEVLALDTDSSFLGSPGTGEMVISFDTLFNPGESTKVAIDTTEYVPLELETSPTTEQQTELKKLLSVSLTPGAARKMRIFTAKRVMKQVVVVLDGKAITLHKIREAITGNHIQITRCDDNACEYLFVKMRDNVKP